MSDSFHQQYSGEDISGIEDIVESVEQGTDPWRLEAHERIERYRKADISIRVIDGNGASLEGARVHIELVRHRFRFGGVISAKRFSGQDPTKDAELYKKVFLQCGFNMAGFNNALKYKLKKGNEHLVPSILEWFKEHDIPVRGHTLIWPGWKHMHKDALELKDNPDELRQFCEKQIIEYAKKWDVVEWDVINEPRGNHALQDILGKEIMVEWFKLAGANTFNRNALLYLNDNRIISAPSGRERNLEIYGNTVKYLLDNGAPLSALGFQSRFKADIPAQELYRRLCLFNEFNLPVAATEFEIASMKNFQPDEKKKAEMTERVMTVYFSHPLVHEIMVWTLFDRGDEKHMIEKDGTPNLRGKVWLYLTKKRWTTKQEVVTDRNGTVKLRGFMGNYSVSVMHKNKKVEDTFFLDKDSKDFTITMN